MESKKLEKPRKNGAFSTRQAVTKPDEETGGVFPTMKPLDKPESAKRAAAGTNCAVPAAEQGPVDFSKVEIEPLFQEFVDFETFAKSDFRAVKVKECTAVPRARSC